MLLENKREQPRISTQECVQVRLPDGSGFCTAGRVVDFSPAGLGILMPESLPVGATVIVEHHGAYLIGTTVYSVDEDHEFRIGVGLEPITATKTGISQLAEATERAWSTVSVA